ncbi:MAG: hypothetical protein K6B14_04105 [Lachnospiraceae bacterium]|nr:hypothetical protein [Lachnospiraceae bacterium]
MVNIIYNQKMGCITYSRDNYTISTMLVSYDDAVKIVNFEGGLLTILMKKNDRNEEEYVDFAHALSSLYMSKMSKQYFDGIKLEDIKLIRR